MAASWYLSGKPAGAVVLCCLAPVITLNVVLLVAEKRRKKAINRKRIREDMKRLHERNETMRLQWENWPHPRVQCNACGEKYMKPGDLSDENHRHYSEYDVPHWNPPDDNTVI
jgi:hypothetical protein